MDTIGIIRIMIGDELAQRVADYAWAFDIAPNEAIAALVRRGSDEIIEECSDNQHGDGEWHVI